MKRLIFLAALVSGLAHAQVIDTRTITSVPQYIEGTPRLVQDPGGTLYMDPIIVYATPTERATWERSCGKYLACRRPTMFVTPEWYQEHMKAVARARQAARAQLAPASGVR